MQQEEPNKYVKELTQEKYKYGFTTEVHTDVIERGLNEDVVRLISSKKDEPEWLLEFRLKSVSPLADAGNADLGTSPYSGDRLSGNFVLCRSDEEERRTKEYG